MSEKGQPRNFGAEKNGTSDSQGMKLVKTVMRDLYNDVLWFSYTANWYKICETSGELTRERGFSERVLARRRSEIEDGKRTSC